MQRRPKHIFFDLDKTIAPARQPILSEMYEVLSSFSEDIVIVSGQEVEKIKWQSNNLNAIRLSQNGNHATEADGVELWNIPLGDSHRAEILAHINALLSIVDHEVNHEWIPIEDRGSQITFSPIGNTAPHEIKMSYDPERKKRNELLAKVPFISDELIVKIGGSTSLDYIHKDRHKGNNVRKLLEIKGWMADDSVYFGDGLFEGGNDESVIGVVDTVPVLDHLDTYTKLRSLYF